MNLIIALFFFLTAATIVAVWIIPGIAMPGCERCGAAVERDGDVCGACEGRVVRCRDSRSC
jgi:hypothetical protein